MIHISSNRMFKQRFIIYLKYSTFSLQTLFNKAYLPFFFGFSIWGFENMLDKADSPSLTSSS